MEENSRILARAEEEYRLTVGDRSWIVNKARNDIEHHILHYEGFSELTYSEVVFILSELAFRWSLQAVKAERGK